ncbi:MAG: ATP-binding cassette domain-containing protein [Parachlamydiales bacterium]|nr:ATP-binding cassette domain-containing protein [Parachlamydiales bacterium]
MIRIENLSKSFPPNQVVLNNLNLTLPKNQMIGVVGPDGAGKTTLLRLITGLLKPTAGRIEVNGCDTIKDSDQIHAFSAYMPQRFGLYEDLTVYQNLDLYASLHGLEPEKREETFEKLLHFTDLGPFLQRTAFALSGGMKQKLGLACALIHKPELLILDEPSVGVDPISRRELWKMVQSLLKEGVSVIWSTTYLDEAEKCDRVVLLNEGQILYEGPPRELTKRVEGRVFRLSDPSVEKRKHLFEIENRPGVIDALIQGDAIRIVSAGNSFDGAEPAAPHLEDAFVDILGGMKVNEWKWSEAAPESKRNSDDVIVAKDLVKKFGSFTAVDHVSFTVKRGEIFGFLGPNGAGKSTTFKMLCGLLKPTQGNAIINGIDVQKAPTLSREQIGYMAQKFSLYGNLSVKQNLEFFSGIYPSIGSVEERLKLFHLDADKSRNAESLSLGFKQKLSLAVATIHWPDVLFLDEPTSGMDPVSRRHFWSQMNGLVRKGKTILISTHFMDEAENCDRIGLIYRGLMIHLDTPDKLKELAKTEENQNPTLEDAFIKLIQEFDAK